MNQTEAGTILTCGHGGCGCRVKVEQACGCEGGSGQYICSCGSPMVTPS